MKRCAGKGADGAAWAASGWGLEAGREGTALWGQGRASWEQFVYLSSATSVLCVPEGDLWGCPLKLEGGLGGECQSVLLEAPGGRCRFCGNPCSAEIPGVGGTGRADFVASPRAESVGEAWSIL